MSTFSKPAGASLNLICCLTAAAIALLLCIGCGGSDSKSNSAAASQTKPWSYDNAESEYRLIKAELALADAKKPYLVLNFRDHSVQLRLNGVLVWEYPMDLLDTDPSELKDFAGEFLGEKHTLVRPILDKQLFGAQDMTPDSVLAIISQATNVKGDLMQRELPARFQLMWAGGLTIDVRTDIEGKPRSKFQNTLSDIRQAIAKPFGREIIGLKMPKESALTLYRASLPGLPTLIIPS